MSVDKMHELEARIRKLEETVAQWTSKQIDVAKSAADKVGTTLFGKGN